MLMFIMVGFCLVVSRFIICENRFVFVYVFYFVLWISFDMCIVWLILFFVLLLVELGRFEDLNIKSDFRFFFWY